MTPGSVVQAHLSHRRRFVLSNALGALVFVPAGIVMAPRTHHGANLVLVSLFGAVALLMVPTFAILYFFESRVRGRHEGRGVRRLASLVASVVLQALLLVCVLETTYALGARSTVREATDIVGALTGFLLLTGPTFGFFVIPNYWRAAAFVEATAHWHAAQDALAGPIDAFAPAFRALCAEGAFRDAARLLERSRPEQRATLTSADLIPLMTTAPSALRVAAVAALADVAQDFRLDRSCWRAA